MNFQEGETLYINKPYGMSSFGALAYVRTRLSRRLGVKRLTVDMTYPTRHITRELIAQTLPRFVGCTEQVPPEYSACSIDGHRAYKMARRGEKVELRAKSIHISELEMTSFDPATMQLGIRVVCGKGTYIRALARDIGEALGSGAFLTMLCRTRVGEVTLSRCIALDDFQHWLDRQRIATAQAENRKSVNSK